MITKRYLIAAAAAASALALLAPAHADTWPQRPTTFIVPFPAGGGTDAFARPLAAQLDQSLRDARDAGILRSTHPVEPLLEDLVDDPAR